MTRQDHHEAANVDSWTSILTEIRKSPRTGASWPTHRARRRNARKRALKRRRDEATR